MLSKNFFARPTEQVAEDLIGNILVKDGMKARIVETEAYLEDDPASHAHPNRTDRNRLMYETYGKIYVYLCYGIHNMLNFTAEEENAGAVLIRAAEPIEGTSKMEENRGLKSQKKLCDGPGKICEALNIDKSHNGTEAGEEISIRKGSSKSIESSSRIGISKAKDRQLRFYESDSSYVSQ